MPSPKSTHRGRECGPCRLCHQKRLQSYAHPVNWSDFLYSELLKIEKDIDKTSCICRNCEKDFKMGVTKASYRPRWKPKERPLKCIVAKCKYTSNLIKTTICTMSKVAEIHDIETSRINDDTVVLCPEHYRKVHRIIHTSDSMYNSKIKCKICQASVTASAARRCRNTVSIKRYYKGMGIEVSLDESDKICTNCYNHHLKVQKSSINSSSTDDELREIVSSLTENSSYDQHIIVSLRATICLLAGALLKRLAVLFPELYDIFVAHALATAIDNDVLTDESSVMTSLPRKCFLTNILSTFGKHLVCECHQLSEGLLLYRTGSNLSQTLSKTLSYVRRHGGSVLQCTLKSSTSIESDIKKTSEEINAKLHTLGEKVHMISFYCCVNDVQIWS